MLGLVLTVVATAMAQDKKAQDILGRVSEKTRSFNSLAANFVVSLTNPEMEDMNESFDGSIKLKGQKYCLNLPDMGVQVISDGTTLWNYMKDGNQVTINNVEDEGSELMDPSSLFTIYEKGFSSKYIAEKTVSGKRVHEIELYPDGEKYDVSKITVYIDKSTFMIHSAVLNSLDGNQYGIEVKKMETNHNFPDSDFLFDASKYPDIEEIDWR